MLKLQQECFNNIKTLCANYKKDSKDRKNEDYLVKRLESLDIQWKDFQTRHALILETVEDKEINYFTENVYEHLKELYQNTKENMEGLLQQIREQKNLLFDMSGMLEEESESPVTTLIEKQQSNFKALDRAMSKIDMNGACETWELEDHLSILKSKWDIVDKQHWELESLLQGSNMKYYNMFVAIEGKYDEMKRYLNSKIWATTHYEKSAPRTEVPEFRGSYEHWISFKNLFMEAIHNNPTINKAQKMQHLKTKLRGEAERLVQHLSISADNYQSCWEILSQRYDNRRLQFTSFVNTMLNLPVIQQPDSTNLKRMHDVITECLNGLANIGIETANWDPLIVHLMSLKLDSATYTDYMKELQDHRELQPLNEFLYFLESKFMAYETIKNSKKDIPNVQKTNYQKSNYKSVPVKKNYYEPKMTYNKTYYTAYGQCPLCGGGHVLMQCPKFVDMNAVQRNHTVTKLRLCENCLYSHGSAKCASMKTCKECNLKHHTLLHNATKNNLPTGTGYAKNSSNPRPSTSTQPCSNHLATDEMEILLPTAQLEITSANGSRVILRALLDQGSQVNLITEKAAQLLRLPRSKLNATISGVGSVSGDCKGRLQLTCKSIHSDFQFDTQALIMKKLTNNLPNYTFEKRSWPHIENLKLADPDFNMSLPVDLLLGADVYSDILLEGVLKGNQQSPIAQQTQLGWILCGKLKTMNCHVTLVDLSEITKYWESEDIVQDDSQDMSKDDFCEQHYSKTVKRAPDGKYIVTMPLCLNYEQKLGNSRSIAISQFLQLEKRFAKQTKLALMYRDFIKEYSDLGHMIPSKPLPPHIPQCYHPHHGVLREQSTTTQIRVVFNASQRTSSGYSLNQLQEKGPILQKDIQALILKWRSYRYAYTADIEKMFRCLWINEDQQHLLKIIWRDPVTGKLMEYKLCTLTYGVRSSPWLAMRTLKQLAIDDGDKYPEAAAVLQTEFYVDDLVSGHNSIPEANKLQTSLIQLLRGAGMNLRKWTANDPALLKNLVEDQISSSKTFEFKGEEALKTLGIRWNTQTDTFTFNWDLQEKPTSKLTKRRLLSEISKLYDPLGWLSPITITAKLIFQRVWSSKVGWDEELPTDIQHDWLKLRAELPFVKNIHLKRWLGGQQNNIQLMGFSDASEKAYSCVIYTYVINADGPPTITLLAAKTRVAPLAQKTTLPRRELLGALLLAQLVEKTKHAFKGYNLEVRAWCDSQVVLAWLQGDISRWERYVANRVDKIKQIIPSENWQYVKSELNPADCASRGLYPKKLLDFKLWWQGPEFINTLKKVPENYNCLFTTNYELKPAMSTTLVTNRNDNFIGKLLNKFSSLTRVTRIVAWILRFAGNARGNQKPAANYLTTCELSAANEQIIKYVQLTEFDDEFRKLTKKEFVSSKSAIHKLNPFLDSKGIMRIGGRLTNSYLPSRMKNPIILPGKGRFTELLIEHAHLTTLHGGPRLTLAYIRQRYWIVGGNRSVKAKLRHCIRCHRHKSVDNNQIMSDLPRQRVTPSRPFTHTGVDFTGHVEVKLNKGRGVKTSRGYISIFVCMATKAVHIELVSDLTTEAFIAAFQRMCARRGTPKHMYSDCGTNFIGASKVLRKEFEEFRQQLSQEFFDEINKLEVEWHFNAPAWPSAGGLWESAVKSLKYHLRRVLGEQKLTYEEFSTLLTQIEGCMNSRPLCPITEDPDEFYNYLCPAHFLTGGPIMSLPMSDTSDDKNISLRRRWQLTENMFQQFWKTWSNEYLTQLQSRAKWNKPTKNIKEGDIVLVKDNNLPPGKWAMGRVLETHPGADGHVRVTTIKTKTGIIKRPIVKLSPLPLQPEIEAAPETKPDLQTKKTTSRTKKCRNKTSTFVTILLTIITLITGTYAVGNGLSSSAHITSIETDRPIYYDTIGKMQIIHDEWTLLMYYNLTNYWTNINRIENYLQGLNQLCEKTDPRYCKTTLEQIAHEKELLDYYNIILLSPHKHLSERKKRGLIDGIGTVARSLFGVLDQEFADQYEKDISAVHNNENHLLQLIKNQTSIVELQNKVLKKTEENINHHFAMMESFMNQTDANLAKVESAIEAMMATSYFNSASLSTYLLIKNMKEMQEMLFDSLTDVYKGHLDVHLLTPVNLLEQLNIISGKLPKSLTLPVENIREDIKNIYKLLYARARVTPNYFLFEVHIPLTSDEDFLLYRAIPLPVMSKNKTTIVELQSQYIAINFEKSTYTSITEDYVKGCSQLKPNIFICFKNQPVFNLHSDKAPCEAKLLSHRSSTPCDVREIPCRDVWIALHTPNSWLAICCGACTLRIVCKNDITSHTMTTSSLVTIAQDCVLQSGDFTIYSHNEYNTKMKMNEFIFTVPNLNTTVNNIVDITHHRLALNVPLESSEGEIEEIDRRIHLLKENEVLPSSISSHDIHQYALGYSLLAIVIIGAAIWIIVRKCNLLSCTRTNRRSTHKHIYEDIELQAMRKRVEPEQSASRPLPPRPKQDPRKRTTEAEDNIAFNFDT